MIVVDFNKEFNISSNVDIGKSQTIIKRKYKTKKYYSISKFLSGSKLCRKSKSDFVTISIKNKKNKKAALLSKSRLYLKIISYVEPLPIQLISGTIFLRD